MVSKIFAALILAGVVAGLFSDSVAVCNCTANECCSLYGYCGIGPRYCGVHCSKGPCCSDSPDGDPCIGNSIRVSVKDVITEDFFNSNFGFVCGRVQSRPVFYTYTAFLTALNSYTRFGTEGSPIDSKREIAAFFAHIAFKTRNHLCDVEDEADMNNYCDESNEENPCTPGKSYHGRGPLKLKWNYNYGPAGRSIGFDGLGSPETVAKDSVVSFKTALWFWMNKVHSNTTFAFGATMKAIYGLNCGNIVAGYRYEPLRLYEKYCYEFNVNPGLNLTC